VYSKAGFQRKLDCVVHRRASYCYGDELGWSVSPCANFVPYMNRIGGLCLEARGGWVGAERYQLLAGVKGYGRRGRKLRGS
jgi:hypothetical protein